MGNNIKFYDTSALLLGLEDAFQDHFVISSITLNELESIKTSANKDSYQKSRARKLLTLLIDNPDSYTVHIFKNSMVAPIDAYGLPLINDTRILATALDYDK